MNPCFFRLTNLGRIGALSLSFGLFSGTQASAAEWHAPSPFAGNATFEGHLLVKRTLGALPGAPEFKIPIEIVYNSSEKGGGFFGKTWRCPQIESRAVFTSSGILNWRSLNGETIAFQQEGSKFKSSDGRHTAKRLSNEGVAITEKNGLTYLYQKGVLTELQSLGRKIIIERKTVGDLDYVTWKQTDVNPSHSSSGKGRNAHELCVFDINLLGQVQNLRIGGAKGQWHHFDFMGGAEIRLARWQLFVSGSEATSNLKVAASASLLTPGSTLTESFIYSDRGFLKAMYDRDNHRFGYACDGEGRLMADDGYAYQVYPKGGGLKMRDRLGGEIKWEMERERKALKITDADGGVQRVYFAVDGKSKKMRVAKILDRAGVKLQENRYDAKGELVERRDKLGNRIRYERDSEGRIISAVSMAAGSQNSKLLAQCAFDNQGRLTRSQDADGAITQIAYSPTGEPAEIIKLYPSSGGTGKQGAEMRFRLGYNDKGWVESVERQTSVPSATPHSKKAKYNYSEDGRLQNYMDFDGNRVEFSYDPNGQITSVAQSPSASPSSVSSNMRLIRDSYGRVTAKIDPLGRRWDYQRDKWGRVIGERDPRGAVTAYEYNRAGHLVGMTDPKGNRHAFTHTAAGQITSMTDPLGNITQWEYSETGQLIRKSNGVQEIGYQYDELNRLTSVDYGHGQVVQYQFDEAGRVARISNPTSAIEYHFDEEHRTMLQRTICGSDIKDLECSTDEKGARTTVWKDGSTGQTLYSEKTVRNPSDGTVELTVNGNTKVNYQYDMETKRLLSKSLPNGMLLRYTYTPDGKLSVMDWQKDGRSVARLGYLWSAHGELLGRSWNGKSIRYVYDPAGQLLAVKAGDKALEAYEYDLAGNMIKRTVDGLITTMSYDQGNRLVRAASYKPQVVSSGQAAPVESVSYQYDRAGRLVASNVQRGASSEKRSFSYGYLDKVIGLQKTTERGAKVEVAYDYLPNGLMAGKVRKETPPTSILAANLPQGAVSDAPTAMIAQPPPLPSACTGKGLRLWPVKWERISRPIPWKAMFLVGRP